MTRCPNVAGFDLLQLSHEHGCLFSPGSSVLLIRFLNLGTVMAQLALLQKEDPRVTSTKSHNRCGIIELQVQFGPS